MGRSNPGQAVRYLVVAAAAIGAACSLAAVGESRGYPGILAPTMVACVLLAVPCGFGFVGSLLAGRRPNAGFWFGFFLGPIGLVVAALLPSRD